MMRKCAFSSFFRASYVSDRQQCHVTW